MSEKVNPPAGLHVRPAPGGMSTEDLMGKILLDQALSTTILIMLLQNHPPGNPAIDVMKQAVSDRVKEGASDGLPGIEHSELLRAAHDAMHDFSKMQQQAILSRALGGRPT